MCLPVNIVKFLRTAFLQNTSSACFWIFFWLDKMETNQIQLQFQFSFIRILFSRSFLVFLWIYINC